MNSIKMHVKNVTDQRNVNISNLSYKIFSAFCRAENAIFHGRFMPIGITSCLIWKDRFLLLFYYSIITKYSAFLTRDSYKHFSFLQLN
jgi:hypothetical protein